MENNVVKGYKVFRPDWSCRPNGNFKQYTCPGKFEEDVTLVRCVSGIHFCKKAADCFNYYQFNPENKVAEVVAYGTVVEDGDKCCTDKLEIIREIPWQELLEIVNVGKSCTGNRNSGDYNSGDYNSGNCNSGDYNSGDYNSGNCNSGNCNSGDYNSGNRNSGNRNKTNFSNGCFNTIEPKIHLFNKPSEWTYQDWLNSDARDILNNCPSNILLWIKEDDITDEEKTAHPECSVIGGFLKQVEKQTERQMWWDSLSDKEKDIVMQLPNFDKSIFKEITGIDVDKS